MKWEFEEDFIVCDFYLSHIDDWNKHLDEVMTELQNAGYVTRDEGSVIMRIQNFRYLHTGKGLSRAANQTKRIYAAFDKRIKYPAFFIALQNFIEKYYTGSAGGSGNAFTSGPQTLTNLVPIEPLGPSFQEVLFDFIDRSGMKDSEVYNACFVGKDTFSHIRKGDRKTTKKTVKQLCFGLKLSYDDAVKLMESAGYAFSNNSISDLVVAYFLKNEEYDIFAANLELYERKEELLFAA